MDYWGNIGGVFLDGKQIGAFKGWQLKEIPNVVARADTYGMNLCQIKQWQGKCRRYRFNSDPSDKILEFRFVTKNGYLKAKGRIKENVAVGTPMDRELTFIGDGMPKSIFK